MIRMIFSCFQRGPTWRPVAPRSTSGLRRPSRNNLFAKVEGGAVADGVSMQAALQTSADNSTWSTLVTYPAAALAAINANGWIVPPTPLPAGLKRYARLSYTAALNANEDPFTGTGKIYAGITPSVDKGL